MNAGLAFLRAIPTLCLATMERGEDTLEPACCKAALVERIVVSYKEHWLFGSEVKEPGEERPPLAQWCVTGGLREERAAVWIGSREGGHCGVNGYRAGGE